MTVNDLAYWYYMGLLVQVIYVAIQSFRKKAGDNETRLQSMYTYAEQEEIPISVFYLILALICLFWPYFLARRVLIIIGLIKK